MNANSIAWMFTLGLGVVVVAQGLRRNFPQDTRGDSALDDSARGITMERPSADSRALKFWACGLALALAGALAPSAQAVGASGELALTTVGVPKGTVVSVNLRGPAGQKSVRVGARRVLDLPPGVYTLTIGRVEIRRAGRSLQRGAVAYPAVRKLRAIVREDRRTAVAVRYAGVVNPGVRPLSTQPLRVLGDAEAPRGLVLPAAARAPRVGTIFLAGPSAKLPRGLVSKVVGVRGRGAQTVVSLVPVAISEAVPHLEFDGSVPFELAPGASAGSASGAEARASAGPCKPPKLLKFGAHLDKVELRQASLSAWPPQMRLTVAVRSTESMGVAAAAAGINCDWTLAELGPYQAVIPVGPIVVPVYASIPLKAGVHINGRLELGTVNVASTTVASVAAGAQESKAALSQQGTKVWLSGAPSLSGSAKLYASLGLEAGIGVAKGANVHIDAGFGPEFSWASGRACDVHLNLGSLSAGVTVLGKDINTPRFTPLKLPVWSGCASGGRGSAGGVGGGSIGGGPGFGPVTVSQTHALASEQFHACAIVGSGSVECWGQTGYGQLGGGEPFTSFDRLEPGPVVGIHDATALAAGSRRLINNDQRGAYTCALRASKTVWCWGDNQVGELGDGTKTWRDVPAPVSGLSDIKGIAASEPFDWAGDRLEDAFACALRENGTIACWGENGAGQLGDGTKVDSLVPVAVADVSGAVEIAAGNSTTCALLSSGRVVCWGQVGFGNALIPASLTPVDLGLSDVAAIEGGGQYWCFLHSDGSVSCRGYLNFELPCSGAPSDNCGGGGSGRFSGPFEDPIGGLPPATAISVAADHACAVLVDQHLACWGFGQFGQLGDGQSGPMDISLDARGPVEPLGLGPVTGVSASPDMTCASLVGGGIDCWGRNNHGQLGNGTTDASSVPVRVHGIPSS